MNLLTSTGYSSEPFNCVAVSTDGNLLAGTTDRVGEDASIYLWLVAEHTSKLAQSSSGIAVTTYNCICGMYTLLFRDLRTGRSPIAQFTESHGDDITHVMLHA